MLKKLVTSRPYKKGPERVTEANKVMLRLQGFPTPRPAMDMSPTKQEFLGPELVRPWCTNQC